MRLVRRGRAAASPTSRRECDLLRKLLDSPARRLPLRGWEVVTPSDRLQLAPKEPQSPAPISRALLKLLRRLLDQTLVLARDRPRHPRGQRALLRRRGRLGDPDRRLAVGL